MNAAAACSGWADVEQLWLTIAMRGVPRVSFDGFGGVGENLSGAPRRFTIIVGDLCE